MLSVFLVTRWEGFVQLRSSASVTSNLMDEQICNHMQQLQHNLTCSSLCAVLCIQRQRIQRCTSKTLIVCYRSCHQIHSYHLFAMLETEIAVTRQEEGPNILQISSNNEFGICKSTLHDCFTPGFLCEQSHCASSCECTSISFEPHTL